MLVEFIRRDALGRYGTERGEFGWILESNGPMISMAEAIGGRINRVYRIYEKPL
jgi:hypothetical protein